MQKFYFFIFSKMSFEQKQIKIKEILIEIMSEYAFDKKTMLFEFINSYKIQSLIPKINDLIIVVPDEEKTTDILLKCLSFKNIDLANE